MDVYLEYMENSQNSALKNKQKKKKKHVGNEQKICIAISLRNMYKQQVTV